MIVQAAKVVESRLSPGAKIAILNFTAPAEAFSDYVLEELSGVLVMTTKITVIERRSLDLIRKEMNLQLSGDVSDDSASAIGKQLGAQAIVSGSLTNLGTVYRFRIKVINVETARIETQVSYSLGNDQQVTFLLNGNQGSAPPVATAPAPNAGGTASKPAATPAPATPAAGKVYKIGDTGPAGGIVFYDKGNSNGGWRYLEVASKDAGKAQWGGRDPAIANGGTATGIGTGKRNTDALINYQRYVKESGRAAQLAREYTQGGYTDWFLPSKDELDLVFKNLRMKYMGDFSMDYYWTSSEYNYEYAWCQRFSDGFQSVGYPQGYKTNTNAVRAVRAF